MPVAILDTRGSPWPSPLPSLAVQFCCGLLSGPGLPSSPEHPAAHTRILRVLYPFSGSLPPHRLPSCLGTRSFSPSTQAPSLPSLTLSHCPHAILLMGLFPRSQSVSPFMCSVKRKSLLVSFSAVSRPLESCLGCGCSKNICLASVGSVNTRLDLEENQSCYVVHPYHFRSEN